MNAIPATSYSVHRRQNAIQSKDGKKIYRFVVSFRDVVKLYLDVAEKRSRIRLRIAD